MAEKKNEKKFCMNCGAEMDLESKFCSKCGGDSANPKITNNVGSRKEKKKMPTWAIVLIVILVIAIIGGAGSSDSEIDDADKSSGSSTQKVEEKIKYTVVTKDELDVALEDNAAAAKDTYYNKYLEISGKLGTIDSDLKYISLVSSTDEWDFLGVHCTIKNKEQKEIVKSLKAGQEIVVKGKITDVGEVLGYYLDITEIVIE